MFRNLQQSPSVSVVGHPYAPIGMGEHARSVFRALQSVGVPASVVDIYGMYDKPDSSFSFDIQGHLSYELGSGVNIFCINGDEVENSLKQLEKRGGGRGYNVIYPAWELEKYPAEWAVQLDKFDEIWAPSKFIESALSQVVNKPVHHMPLACEIGQKTLATRRIFSVPESSYAFLFAFDFLSYMERKNPEGLIEAFRRLCERQPEADVVLIIKTNNGDRNKPKLDELRQSVLPVQDRVVILDETFSDADMKALIYLSDCFVSLHRSEGFGRGIAEAMRLGKPVIATAYSGNMDYCNADLCLLVDYELIPIKPGQYPHWEGQVWAEPRIDDAVEHMERLVMTPEYGRDLGRRARVEMMRGFSYSAIGLRYKTRLSGIVGRLDRADEVAKSAAERR